MASINPTLRQRINRLAHAQGQIAALQIRQKLLAELAAMAKTGANTAQLVAHLDSVERHAVGEDATARR